MKKCLSLVILLVITGWMSAADYTAAYQQLPIQLKQPVAPSIKDTRVDIRDYGAKGDGQTLCTEAVQKAIDDIAANGGGHIVFPAGIWLTAPLRMKSGIDLHIERNAVLQLTEERSQHVRPGNRRAENGIYATDAHDISITGQGIIDGNGEYWRAVKRGKNSDVEWKAYQSLGGTTSTDGSLWYPFNLKHQANIAATMEQQEKMRSNMVRFNNCQRVMVQGVTLQNSPKFHLTPNDCQDVIIDGVTVRCPWNAQNGDAIDIGTSQRVLITSCVIDCGDDGICMKGATGDEALKHKPCEDILIKNNTVYHAHGGFVIGSEFSAGMYRIVVCDNTFSGTDTGLRFKSATGRGGRTDEIYCYNITMTDIAGEAIVFETTYADKAVSGTTGAVVGSKWVPNFNGINIYNITCNGAKTGIRAKGAKGMVHDINISNSVIFFTKEATDIDTDCDVRLKDVKFVTYK